jgi:beta-glucosidase
MMPSTRSFFATVAAFSLILLPAVTAPAAEREFPAIVPVPQAADWWMPQHERVLARVRQRNVDLLMIGDSITQGWGGEGQRVWEIYYGHRRALNLGFNGDRTEQVLWRLQHEEIDGIMPKVAVVMIGTNNSGMRKDPPEQTAAGVQAILAVLRARLSEMKILLLGIFPRGAEATDSVRRVNDTINDRLRQLADSQHVFYLDLGYLFLDPEGRLRLDLMPDLLHPNERGYQVWAEGMEDRLKLLLGE